MDAHRFRGCHVIANGAWPECKRVLVLSEPIPAYIECNVRCLARMMNSNLGVLQSRLISRVLREKAIQVTQALVVMAIGIRLVFDRKTSRIEIDRPGKPLCFRLSRPIH